MIIDRRILDLANLINQVKWNYEPLFLNIPRADGRRRPIRFSYITVGDLTQVVEDRVRRAVRLLDRWQNTGSQSAFRAAAHAVAQANRMALLQQCCYPGSVGGDYAPFTYCEEASA